jgi:hypothetical protein
MKEVISHLLLGSMLYAQLLLSAELPDNLQFHGFLSQGYNLSSGNNFFGSSNDNNGSFEFTEFGINSSWLSTSNLQLSGQLLFRQAGETDNGSLRVDYALIDYTFLSDEANRWGVRLGRIKNPSGFYNETRDVAFTRPTVLLPQSIYLDRTRSLVLSSDGVYLYGERRTDYGDLNFQAGVYYPQAIDRELEPVVFTTKLPGHFDSAHSYIGRLLYDWDGGRFRAAVTYLKANLDYHSSYSAFDVPSGSIRIEPWIFSLQYNAENWGLTAEYSTRDIYVSGMGGPTTTTNEQAYYLQGSYRFSPHWEAVLRYDVFYNNVDDKNGEEFAAFDPLGRPAYTRFAKDWTVGLNWNINSQFSVRTEYHKVHGTAWLTPLDNPDISEVKERWNLFLIMASYRF